LNLASTSSRIVERQRTTTRELKETVTRTTTITNLEDRYLKTIAVSYQQFAFNRFSFLTLTFPLGPNIQKGS